MQSTNSSEPNKKGIGKGRIIKLVEEPGLQEEMATLRKDPRFRALVDDIKSLSVDRQEALAAEMSAMTD